MQMPATCRPNNHPQVKCPLPPEPQELPPPALLPPAVAKRETCFSVLALPHLGHSISLLFVNETNSSNFSPQSLHKYSYNGIFNYSFLAQKSAVFLYINWIK
jgi:hypothetical protein